MQAARAVQKSARKGRQKRKRQEAGAESVFRITEAEPLPENLLEHVEELAEVGRLTASAQLGSDLCMKSEQLHITLCTWVQTSSQRHMR